MPTVGGSWENLGRKVSTKEHRLAGPMWAHDSHSAGFLCRFPHVGSCRPTRTHPHICTNSHIHACVHLCTHMQKYSHTHTQACTLTYSLTHTGRYSHNTRIHMHAYGHTQACTRMYMLVHSYTPRYTPTDTHSYTDSFAPLHRVVFSHVTSLLPPRERSSSPVPQLRSEDKTPRTTADLHHTKGSYTNAQTLPSGWGVFSPGGPNSSQFYLNCFFKKKKKPDCILIVL